MLELICKELEVELDEVWLGNDKNYYKIEKDDILIRFENDEVWYSASSYVYKHILLGLIKPVWIPKWGDEYYIPLPNAITPYGCRRYTNVTITNIHFQRGLIFKTPDEAIECANRMLEVVNNDNNTISTSTERTRDN